MTRSAPAHPRPLPLRPGQARRELRSLLESEQWPGDVDGAILAVHEALMNSHDHAGGCSSATAGLEGSTLVVIVCDTGPGFSPRASLQPPGALAERGRGLWLIDQIADSWEVRRTDGKTCVELRFEPSE